MTHQIKVLGAGCKNCHTLLKNTQDAVQVLSLDAQIEYVTDMKAIIACGVMRLPALMLDGKMLSTGQVLKTADIIKLLQRK